MRPALEALIAAAALPAAVGTEEHFLPGFCAFAGCAACTEHHVRSGKNSILTQRGAARRAAPQEERRFWYQLSTAVREAVADASVAVPEQVEAMPLRMVCHLHEQLHRMATSQGDAAAVAAVLSTNEALRVALRRAALKAAALSALILASESQAQLIRCAPSVLSVGSRQRRLSGALAGAAAAISWSRLSARRRLRLMPRTRKQTRTARRRMPPRSG